MTTTTTTTTSQVGSLILVRLLTTRSLSVKQLGKEFDRFFKRPPAPDDWQGHVDELKAGGLLTTRPLSLTDTGRAEALSFLGADAVPPRTTWPMVVSHYLVPKALGLDESSKNLRKRLARQKDLGLYLLRAHYDLPVAGTASPKDVLDSLACKLICDELGIPPQSTLKAVRDMVLSREVGSTEQLDAKSLETQMPRHVFKVRPGARDGLQEAVLRGWLDVPSTETADDAGEPVRPTETEEFDLTAFARTVQTAAADCPSGWFGNNKVFISHVWQCVRNEQAFRSLDLAAFKERLVEANRDDLLRLERADLVQAMDPADVRESETTYLNAHFHFVLVERSRP